MRGFIVKQEVEGFASDCNGVVLWRIQPGRLFDEDLILVYSILIGQSEFVLVSNGTGVGGGRLVGMVVTYFLLLVNVKLFVWF